MNSSLSIAKTDGPSLRTGFLKHAATRPHAPAVVVRGQTISYGQMEHDARVWAGAIVKAVSGPVRRVGVFAYRSHVSYTGTFAAMFAGAAFVPLSPTIPLARTARMIEWAELDAILVDKTCAAHLHGLLAHLPECPPLIVPEIDLLDGLVAPANSSWRRDLAQAAPMQCLVPLIASDLAYLLFTSGSTGTPKGVPVSHANVCRFIAAMHELYKFCPDDRFSQTADQTFDLCIPELYLAWDSGACVCSAAPNDLISPSGYVSRHQITIWISVPSVPAVMRQRGILEPGTFPSIRVSLFCGEPLPLVSAELWQAATPNGVIHNLYGPTEVTVACFGHTWDGAASPELCTNGIVPIGHPFPGVGAAIVDEQLQPVSDGEAGELLLWGEQTTGGYWMDPVRTSESYIDFPPAGIIGRCYRTGDRAVRLPTGEFCCLGRLDHQIKVLGHRVETGEVEAVLSRDPAVIHAAAFGWPVFEGVAQGVVAFVSGEGVNVTALKSEARRLLPAYMQPSTIHLLPTMPLNRNGKVDRLALMGMLESAHADEAARSMRNAT